MYLGRVVEPAFRHDHVSIPVDHNSRPYLFSARLSVAWLLRLLGAIYERSDSVVASPIIDFSIMQKLGYSDSAPKSNTQQVRDLDARLGQLANGSSKQDANLVDSQTESLASNLVGQYVGYWYTSERKVVGSIGGSFSAYRLPIIIGMPFCGGFI